MMLLGKIPRLPWTVLLIYTVIHHEEINDLVQWCGSTSHYLYNMFIMISHTYQYLKEYSVVLIKEYLNIKNHYSFEPYHQLLLVNWQFSFLTVTIDNPLFAHN